MIKRKSQILVLWFLLWDLAITVLAWIAAYHLRFDAELVPVTAAPAALADCYRMIPLVLLMSALAYQLTGQYVIHRFRRLREEAVSIFKGTALMGLLVIAGTFGLRSSYESRATFLIFLILTAPLLLCARRLSWLAIRWVRSRGFNQTQAIIVGTGRVARKTARALRVTSWLGIKNIGFVEDQPSRWTGDLDILGNIADLPQLVGKYQVSHVFICVPMTRYHEARRVFDTLAQTLVEVRVIADVPALAGLSLTTTYFEGMPMVGLRESPHFGLNIVVKRLMDVVLSALALVLLSPVMLAIAAIIKLTSPGPRVLSPGALRLQRAIVCHAQVPQHAPECRTGERGRVGGQGRPAPHLVRHVPA
jgi:FlaA1/EpsC-like NDP-sugar epimerase